MTCYSGFGSLADFGQRPVWIGDFDASGRADVLFYFVGDQNWWLGRPPAPTGPLAWSLAGNTVGFGQIWDGRPFWIGNFSRADRAQVLFYYPGDDNWWLGSHDGNQLQWSFAGNTAGFGHIWDGRPFYVGNFGRPDRAEMLFYYPGDGNWWLGSHDGNQLRWSFSGNTGRPCSQSIRVHFKSLIPISNAVRTFMDTQFLAMEDLFSQSGIATYRGTTEDLSADPALQALVALDVGACTLGNPTQEQNTLFQNRNNAGANDLVVYVVQTLVGGAGNFVGCATHPAGQPGAAVVQANAPWLLAHEIGHVLDLRHVAAAPATNSDFLMWPNTGWTNVPPDVSSPEATTMLNSGLSVNC